MPIADAELSQLVVSATNAANKAEAAEGGDAAEVRGETRAKMCTAQIQASKQFCLPWNACVTQVERAVDALRVLAQQQVTAELLARTGQESA